MDFEIYRHVFIFTLISYSKNNFNFFECSTQNTVLTAIRRIMSNRLICLGLHRFLSDFLVCKEELGNLELEKRALLSFTVMQK